MSKSRGGPNGAAVPVTAPAAAGRGGTGHGGTGRPAAGRQITIIFVTLMLAVLLAAHADALPPIFLYLVPVLGAGFLLSFFLAQKGLRTTGFETAADPGLAMADAPPAAATLMALVPAPGRPLVAAGVLGPGRAPSRGRVRPRPRPGR